MSASSFDPNRRIVVGVTADGRSTVIADSSDIAEAEPSPGYRVQELWNQASLPAEVHDDGITAGVIDMEPPGEGARAIRSGSTSTNLRCSRSTKQPGGGQDGAGVGHW